MATNMTIINARAVTGGRVSSCNLRIAEGKIRGILPPGDTYGKTYDARGCLVLPGFIDVHTHGGCNVDFNNAEPKDIRAARDFFVSQGVTTFLPTILADTEETMLRAALSVAKARQSMGCSQIGGIHLEGPFLAPDYRGDLPERLLQSPSYPAYRRLQDACEGLVRILTISPELPGAAERIHRLNSEGIRVSLGHTGADYDTAAAAIEAGAVSATHTLNAMAWMTPSAPSVSAAVLESDIFCEAICDGRHLHPAILRLLIKTKGLRRVVAVTDSTMAAGLSDGVYRLGSVEVVVRGGDARLLSSGERAGSTLTMLASLRNLMKFTGLPVEQAVLPLTENPARLLGISHQKGSIDVGKDADLVVLDSNWKVRTTFSQGEILYSDETGC